MDYLSDEEVDNYLRTADSRIISLYKNSGIPLDDLERRKNYLIQKLGFEGIQQGFTEMMCQREGVLCAVNELELLLSESLDMNSDDK